MVFARPDVAELEDTLPDPDVRPASGVRLTMIPLALLSVVPPLCFFLDELLFEVVETPFAPLASSVFVLFDPVASGDPSFTNCFAGAVSAFFVGVEFLIGAAFFAGAAFCIGAAFNAGADFFAGAACCIGAAFNAGAAFFVGAAFRFFEPDFFADVLFLDKDGFGEEDWDLVVFVF